MKAQSPNAKLLPLLGLLAASLALPTAVLAQTRQTTTTTTTVAPPPPPAIGPDGRPLPPPPPGGWAGKGPGMGMGRHGGHHGPHHGMMKLRLVPLNADLGAYFRTTQGLLVAEAAPDNALGLKAGDVLQSVNGTAVNDPRAVWMAVRAAGGPGATVTLGAMRQGQPLSLRATLPTREAMMQDAQRLRAERRATRGMPPMPPVPPTPPAPPAPPAPAY